MPCLRPLRIRNQKCPGSGFQVTQSELYAVWRRDADTATPWDQLPVSTGKRILDDAPVRYVGSQSRLRPGFGACVCRQLQLAVYEFVWGVKNLTKTLVFSDAALCIRGDRPVFTHLITDKEQGRPAMLHGGSSRRTEFRGDGIP